MEAAVNVRDKTFFWCALVLEVVILLSCEAGLLGFLLKSFYLCHVCFGGPHSDL